MPWRDGPGQALFALRDGVFALFVWGTVPLVCLGHMQSPLFAWGTVPLVSLVLILLLASI